MKSFPDKVREARKLRNLSQAELAGLIGVSTRAVVSYETAGVFPRHATLKKLAEVLHVSESYLTDAQNEDPLSGLENTGYLDEAREQYGARAEREIRFLMERNSALFAGGDVPQDAKDAYFEAVMQAYLACKAKAREKFGGHDM